MADFLVTFACRCGKRLSAPSSAEGRAANCPRCRSRVVVPPLLAPDESDDPAPIVTAPPLAIARRASRGTPWSVRPWVVLVYLLLAFLPIAGWFNFRAWKEFSPGETPAAPGASPLARPAASGLPDPAMKTELAGVVIDGDQVALANGPLMGLRFDRGDPFDGSYMVFGTSRLSETRLDPSTLVTVVPMDRIEEIHRLHPDFTQCRSGGKELVAQSAVTLYVIPRDTAAARSLREVLREGIHVGLDLVGENLVPVELGLEGEPVTFVLVDRARRFDAMAALPR